MLRKVIDNFDIDTYGWFNDEPFDDSNTQPNHAHIKSLTDPASDVWGLWVKTPTDFVFDNSVPTLLNTASHLSRILQQKANIAPGFATNPSAQRIFISNFVALTMKGNTMYSLHDYDHFKTLAQDDQPNTVHLPNYLLSPEVLNKVGDRYLLADAITGHGLEALEALTHTLPPLGMDGMGRLEKLHAESLDTEYPAYPDFVNPISIIAACTLDIWWATQLRDIRSHILTKWPGWSDIFTAQDTVSMPAVDTMQSVISKKSPNRCELRRFCMAIAWNLNPNAPRLTFPRPFKQAYDAAISAWPTVAAAPNDNGAKLRAIEDFVVSLISLLSIQEKKSDRHTTNSGTNHTNLDGTREKHRKNPKLKSSTTHVQPHDPTTETTTDVPPPGVIATPINWAQFKNLKAYAQDSAACHAKYRKQIADQISASAWFVPNPPPLEHGNLDGTLDEGNLLRYAAFSDPNIFSVSPASGSGQIAIGILVDSSGSMSAHSNNSHFCNLQTALCFVGGLRDGLARNPNVKLEAFTYDGRLINPDHKIGYDDNFIRMNTVQGYRSNFVGCMLRRLDTDDDLLYTTPGSSTPTSSALLTLDQHLTTLYPEAQRIIIILTDGAPGACIYHPHFPEAPDFVDNEEQVRKVVSSISTPVFCVGIDVDTQTLNSQYNVGHSFPVDTPMAAVQVACDLVRGIGQSLNC